MKKAVRAIILVPTRELCDQVRDVITGLARYCAKLVTICTLSGDVSVAEQKYARLYCLTCTPRHLFVSVVSPWRPKLAELPDIVVATPSRLAAHLKEKACA